MGIRDLFRALLGLRPRYLQVAALCLRGKGERREVLLVTSRGRGRWILPKGWPMTGRSLAEAALQEAWEEAGAKGRVQKKAIGRYRYQNLLGDDIGLPVEARVYQIDQIRLADEYPEAGQRERRWWPLAEAADAVDETELAALLRGLAADHRAAA
ncbi:MAG: NUDIX hydrolase [Pseudomonadota bacterium]|nr:NUDIX hydrolase [Pseudomonadota bacterium]